ncbi:hypothetical protein CPC08DRAFT_715598 [Agrocybe pediades]|nr:hypothetical protein CPC08DRAFT_715598 [Agrocybe pediades]
MLAPVILPRILVRPLLSRTFSVTRASLVGGDAPKPPEYHEGRLEGTAGQHDCYILLHTSLSPEEFPSVYKTPLQLELVRRASKWGGTVNFSRLEGEPATPDTQPATVFSHLGGKLEIPNVTMENLDEVEELIQNHMKGPITKSTSEDMHIYVCTHGARDCRCGERGVQVFKALLHVVKKERDMNPNSPARFIKVGEVGHVGGHKYAANVLLYPQGEWLGAVKPEDAPSIISQACAALEKGVRPLDANAEPLFISKWRGRMGLSKEAQKELFMKVTSGQKVPDASELDLQPASRA